MALSNVQKEALRVLARKGQGNSYKLGLRLDTLRSLVSRGFATSRAELGAMAFPHTSIQFKITKAGEEEAAKL
jgi:hypothetical protein